jgi:hypothetical protein
LLLGISVRQLRRVRAADRDRGVEALVHGNRCRAPANTLAADLAARVVELTTTTYVGFNQHHLTEMLAEHEGVFLSRSTVRGIQTGAGVPAPRRRRPPRHRQRRVRYPREGMLLQVDGSRHDRLEGRGPYLSLVGAIAAAVIPEGSSGSDDWIGMTGPVSPSSPHSSRQVGTNQITREESRHCIDLQAVHAREVFGPVSERDPDRLRVGSHRESAPSLPLFRPHRAAAQPEEPTREGTMLEDQLDFDIRTKARGPHREGVDPVLQRALVGKVAGRAAPSGPVVKEPERYLRCNLGLCFTSRWGRTSSRYHRATEDMAKRNPDFCRVDPAFRKSNRSHARLPSRSLVLRLLTDYPLAHVVPDHRPGDDRPC